jgi:DNA-binding MarR family transcriptional regulator
MLSDLAERPLKRAGRLCRARTSAVFPASRGTWVKLQQEIKQTKPFPGIEQEALLNLQRTAGQALHLTQQMLKPHGLTPSQYNVLRILRGAGPDGLRCMEIGERMLSHDPDITRLLERLLRQRLIERRRDGKDRRVIYSRISAEGLRLLKELDPEIEESAKLFLGHMNVQRLELLIDLLEEARQGLASAACAEAKA